MERVIINTIARSGGTVYLAQYWHARGWQTFDEPWGGRLKEATHLHKLLIENNKTAKRIAIKHHPCSQSIPQDFNVEGWHMITYVRRNLLEQTLSYALARDKVKNHAQRISS